jgi:hypothetical protein
VTEVLEVCHEETYLLARSAENSGAGCVKPKVEERTSVVDKVRRHTGPREVRWNK